MEVVSRSYILQVGVLRADCRIVGRSRLQGRSLEKVGESCNTPNPVAPRKERKTLSQRFNSPSPRENSTSWSVSRVVNYVTDSTSRGD